LLKIVIDVLLGMRQAVGIIIQISPELYGYQKFIPSVNKAIGGLTVEYFVVFLQIDTIIFVVFIQINLLTYLKVVENRH